MTGNVKSIIEVEVQDEAFQRFQTLFAAYEEKVKELPGDWRKVDDAMGGAAKRFAAASGQTDAILAGMAASSGVIAESIHDAFAAQRKFEAEARKSFNTMGNLGTASGAVADGVHKSTRGQHQFEAATRKSHTTMNALGAAAMKTSHTIFGMGKWMLKMGVAGAGIAGIAAGFGMDDLAGSALSRQRSARGVGMTPGQAASFSTNFNQFGNADAFAANIANARNDVSKRWVFAGLGIGQKALQHDSNFQLSLDAEKKMQIALKKMPRADWMNEAQARGYNLLASTEQMRLDRHTSVSRMNSAVVNARNDVHSLGFSSAVGRDWINLDIQLRKAGIEIESSLITGLHKLAPVLTALSTSVTKSIAGFAKGPEMGIVVNDIVKDLKKFGGIIEGSNFQKGLNNFANSIGELAGEIGSVARFLAPYAKALDPTMGKKGKAGFNPYHPGGGLFGPPAQPADHSGSGLELWIHNQNREKIKQIDDWSKKHTPWMPLAPIPPKWTQHNNPLDLMPGGKLEHFGTTKQGIQAGAALLRQYPTKHQADTLASIIQIWNGHGKNDPEYIRRVSRWSGIKPDAPIDMDNKATMAKVISAMSREEGTDRVTRAQATAALSGGPAGLPAKVERLVDTLRRQKPMRPQQVTIRNQTSARVAIQANAAGY